MCITKTGQDNLPTYLWKGIKGVKDFFKWIPKSPAGKAGKAIGTSSGSAFTKTISPVVKGLAATGKFLYNKPSVAIPLAGMAYIGGKKMLDNTHKNMYHVDPKYNITHANALGQIKYNNPDRAKEYKELSIFNV